ncbi:MAG: hypothetical protein ACE145_03775 [Terriglobia bacterium]
MTPRSRIVACLMALLFLASEGRWVQSAAPGQGCACPPSACMCGGHEHGSGHAPMCSMNNGGHCGVRSADIALTSFADQPLPAPAETSFDITLAISDVTFRENSASTLQGYSQPLERPPC